MIKPQETITYFKSRTGFTTSQLKFSCFKMATSSIMIVGTKNGGIVAYQLDPSTTAKILIDFQQPFKLPVTRIDCLGDCYNLLLNVDNNLYYYNTGKKKAKEIIKSVQAYEIVIIDKKPYLFVAVKNKILKYNVDELYDNEHENKKEVILLKEYTFDNVVRTCAHSGGHLIVSLAVTKEVLFLDLQSLQSRDANLLKTDDILIHSLSTGEVLVLMKYDKQNFIGIFLNEEGTTAKTRNSINIGLKDKINRISSNQQFIIVNSQTENFVYNLHDNRLLQTFEEPELKNGAYFDFFDDFLFAITENSIFSFSKITLNDILKETKNRLIYALGVSLLKTISTEDNFATIGRQITDIYSFCAWTFLTKNKFDEALECFSSFNFDPPEILHTVMDQYDINRKFEFISYPDQLKKFIKVLFLKKRAEILREGDSSLINGNTIVRRSDSSVENVKAKDWLAIVDYAYVRACIELDDLFELFDFLRKSTRVYCDDRNRKLSMLFRIIESRQGESEISLALLAELNIVLNNNKEALKYLKLVALSEKHKTRFDFDKYARNRASEVLSKSEQDEQFSSLIAEHFEWMSSDFEVMKLFFQNLSLEGKIINQLLTQIDLIELEKTKFTLKAYFLVQVVKSLVDDEYINGEYFICQLHLFRINGDISFLLSADNFIQNEKYEFIFNEILQSFREIKEKIFPTSEKNDNVKALLLNTETHILKRMNTYKSHQEALNKLLQMEEFSLAEDYCASANTYTSPRRTSFKTNDGKGRIFLLNQLLELYVKLYKDQNGKDKYMNLISEFLKKFAGNPNLDAVHVINLLPEDLKVNEKKFDFFGFIEATFTELNAREKEVGFKKSISEAYYNTINYDLTRKYKRWVRIDDDSYCFKCGNKILQKVFDVYPNGVVIDHFCMSELKEKDSCPITHQNFRRTNPF
jgi:hypothetical protein